MWAVLSLIPKSEYERIRHRNLSRHGMRARLKPGHMRIDKAIVMKAAPEISRRLRSGAATISGLMKEYHTAYSTIMCAVESVMSESEYKQVRHRNFSRPGTRTRLKPGHRTWNKGKKGVTNPGSEKGSFKQGHAAYSHAPGHKTRPNDDIRLIVRLASHKRRNQFDGDGRPIPQDVRDSLEVLRQTVKWWECIGCGYDFEGEPAFSCPKCGGLRFAIISQKNRAVS